MKGNVLKGKMRECELTQAKAAEEIGITDSAVAQWEMGLTHPKFENLIKLAKLYKCSVDKLLKEE